MIVAGLDVGTTGCKIVLYNDKAELLSTYYNEYPAHHQGGQHEIDFADVKKGVLTLLKKAVQEYPIDALGVTSFGESFVMLDEQDNILAPAMLYTDPRGEEECEELCRKVGKARLTLTTGVKPHSMYSLPKMMWLKNHRPELFAGCKRMLLGEDFVVYTLTGKAQINDGLAARTGAFDIEQKCWMDEALQAAGIDKALLSRPVAPGTVAGTLRPELKVMLGIDYDITVVSGFHDQIAGMIGAGVFTPEQAMDGTGTVECIPVVLSEKPTDLSFYEGGYSVVPYPGDKYACYAFSFTGGATIKWFKDTFDPDSKDFYAKMDAGVPEGPTGILVLPHFAGAATPYMDNAAKAAFVGVTLETNKYDLYKALMEGTSYEMLLNFNTLGAQIPAPKELRATGGGANSDIWLQIKADILNTRIVALSCKEVGAAGTAALTGVAVGAYEDLADTVAKMVTERKVFTPNEAHSAAYAALYKKYTGLYKAVKGLEQ